MTSAAKGELGDNGPVETDEPYDPSEPAFQMTPGATNCVISNAFNVSEYAYEDLGTRNAMINCGTVHPAASREEWEQAWRVSRGRRPFPEEMFRYYEPARRKREREIAMGTEKRSKGINLDKSTDGLAQGNVVIGYDEGITAEGALRPQVLDNEVRQLDRAVAELREILRLSDTYSSDNLREIITAFRALPNVDGPAVELALKNSRWGKAAVENGAWKRVALNLPALISLASALVNAARSAAEALS